MSSKSLRRGAFAAALALVALAVGSPLAANESGTEAHDAGTEARESTELANSGGVVSLVRVVNFNTPSSTGNTVFTTVAGQVISIPVAANSSALIVAQYAFESRCSGTCLGRILIGGSEANPISGADSIFNTTAGGIGTHALDRSRCVRNSTTSTVNFPVVVQHRVLVGGQSSTIDDDHLTVFRSGPCT